MTSIIVKIRSEYYESDSSRLRLGISINTLIPSLKNQTNKDFQILCEQSPMDPYYTKRKDAFKAVAPHRMPEQRIEIEVGDDDFLCPTFIEQLQNIPLQRENTSLLFPNGFIFHESRLLPWRGRNDLVQVTMRVSESLHVGRVMEVTHDPSWIYVRHQINATVIPSSMIVGSQIKNLTWPGWKENVVARYCRVEVKTATAQGSTLEPRKSKSVVIPSNSSTKGKRR